MLALDDAALARVVRAARAISWRKRSRWLREIAAELDPPTIPKTVANATNATKTATKTPAAARQARVRQRRKNAVHVYRPSSFPIARPRACPRGLERSPDA